MARNFYSDIMQLSEKQASDNVSNLDYQSIKSTIDGMDLNREQMEALAAEITGIFSKTADDANIAPEATIEGKLTTPEEVNDVAEAQAVSTAREGLESAGAALNTLEAIKAGEQQTADAAAQQAQAMQDAAAAQQMQQQQPAVSPDDTQKAAFLDQFQSIVKMANDLGIDFVQFASDAITKEAADSSDGEGKESETDGSSDDGAKDGEQSDDKPADSDSSDSESDDSDEKDAAEAEIMRILKEGSEEEREQIVKEAYDISLVKMANDGVTLGEYVLSLIGDEKLASEITEMSEKIARDSSMNYLRVADELIGTMSYLLEDQE